MANEKMLEVLINGATPGVLAAEVRRLMDLHALHEARVSAAESKLAALSCALDKAVEAGAVAPVTQETSDGYHTFAELYEHRHRLWIALCFHSEDAWRSLRHSDGELAFGGGWFVLGIGRDPGDQITYHLPESFWGSTEFAQTLERAPAFDGHTSADVLERLGQLDPTAKAGWMSPARVAEIRSLCESPVNDTSLRTMALVGAILSRLDRWKL